MERFVCIPCARRAWKEGRELPVFHNQTWAEHEAEYHPDGVEKSQVRMDIEARIQDLLNRAG